MHGDECSPPDVDCHAALPLGTHATAERYQGLIAPSAPRSEWQPVVGSTGQAVSSVSAFQPGWKARSVTAPRAGVTVAVVPMSLLHQSRDFTTSVRPDNTGAWSMRVFVSLPVT